MTPPPPPSSIVGGGGEMGRELLCVRLYMCVFILVNVVGVVGVGRTVLPLLCFALVLLLPFPLLFAISALNPSR